jgi:hypothetical protein
LKRQGLSLESDVIISLVPSRITANDKRLYKNYREALNNGLDRATLLEIPESPILRWTERVITTTSKNTQDSTARAFREIGMYCLGERRRG